MSKIRYELFGSNAEISAFSSDDSGKLTMFFPDIRDGFLSLDGMAVRISDGVAVIDMRYVSDCEFRPTLIQENEKIDLPPLKKVGRCVQICAPGTDYIHALSLRERKLSKRVDALEREIAHIRESIYGKTIL